MKFKCRGCNDIFDIPDGKGITRAVCPFCDQTNDLREPAAPEPTFPEKAMATKTFPQSFKPAKPPPHPLAPQFWILSVCAIILTTLVVVSTVLTILAAVYVAEEQRVLMEKVTEVLNEASRELTKAFNPTPKP